MTAPDLNAYLARIGFKGAPRVDLDTLTRLHEQHLRAIPYENLDVYLGRGAPLDIEHCFTKLVLLGRGGWCYEMNGLFAWALEQIGFSVMRMAGGVRRDMLGDRTVGGHLVLCVALDEPWLVDVGFGDGLILPAPLRPGQITQAGFQYELRRLEGRWWRFLNHPRGGALSFDFEMQEASPPTLAERSAWLQSAIESPFRRNAICQRRVNDGFAVLRNDIYQLVGPTTTETRTLASAAEYAETLRSVFDLPCTDADQLWAQIQA